MLIHFTYIWLFETIWTANCQAPLSMGFSRQEYWSGLLCPPQGDLPWIGTKYIKEGMRNLNAWCFNFITTKESLEAPKQQFLHRKEFLFRKKQTNYRTLMKEIKDDSKKGKDDPCCWISKLISLRWPSWKQSTDLIQSLSKYL